MQHPVNVLVIIFSELKKKKKKACTDQSKIAIVFILCDLHQGQIFTSWQLFVASR